MTEAKLFVSGIPNMYSKDDVHELFARNEIGRPIEVRLLPEKPSHPCRSAFVKYASRDEADRAIKEMDGIEFDSAPERLGVKFATVQSERARERDSRDRRDGGAPSHRDPRDRHNNPTALPRGGGGGGGPAAWMPPPQQYPPQPYPYPQQPYPAQSGGPNDGYHGDWGPPPGPNTGPRGAAPRGPIVADRDRGAPMAGGRGPIMAERRMLAFTVTEDRRQRLNCKVLDKVLMSQCGRPEKVLIKPNRNRDGATGFVLMKCEADALRAIDSFSGRHIFTDELMIDMSLSDKADVEVRYNNHLSWDYNRELPTSAPAAKNPILSDDDFGGGMGGPGGRDPRDMGRGGRRDDYGCDPRDRSRGYDDRGGPSGRAQCSPVVLINGLMRVWTLPSGETANTTVDDVATIAGVYGDVMRVRLLRSKRGADDPQMQALVEYRRPEEAEIAKGHLVGCPILGGTLKVFHSEKREILAEKGPEGEDAQMFRDYSAVTTHRYGPNFPVQRLYAARAPCNVLYMSGLDASMEDDQLMDIFGPEGAVAAEMFRNKKTEAKVEFQSVEGAFNVLVRFHGKKSIGAGELPVPVRIAFADRSVTKEKIITVPRGGGKGAPPAR
eukprot:TRINITY_DN3015_c1_g1_i1.p1 TRINITY_DN3015_c1_g1~~TRINITY_DN3015_c1_g1_i1.p1  ORF type:complete len:628 (+),score=194.85 TRINITY_DN3015_c1_g1_i1:63-1886(+)